MAIGLSSKISSAAKWSALGEIMAKLVSPISTIVLAHILKPQAFGVIATITMIISFAEIFMDAGFQRYVIQREYEREEDKFNCATVAFWTNLALGIVLWIIIALFNVQLAELVGNAGLGVVLCVAGLSIPINAVTSIQMAIFKHSLDFKSLFYRRLVSVIIPVVITIPLAFYLRSYWALVWGTIASNIATAIVLTLFSPWRPTRYYDVSILKGMIGYSSWTLVDALLIWATTYFEVFIIAIVLDNYYLGLYKTAISTVHQFISLISGIVLPILMPALSRTQNDFNQMCGIILKMQKYSGFLLLPLGAIVFSFRNQLTDIVLGSQWGEIAEFIGIWALSEVIMLLFARFCSNVFPAIGKPHISVILQAIHLSILIPVVYISSKYSFEALYWSRTLIRIQSLIFYWIFVYRYIKLSALKMISNVGWLLIVSILIILEGDFLVYVCPSNWLVLLWIPISLVSYISLLYIIPSERSFLVSVKNRLFDNIKVFKR